MDQLDQMEWAGMSAAYWHHSFPNNWTLFVYNFVYTPLSCSLVVCIRELPVCGLVGELPGGRAGQEWRRDDLCCCGGSRSHGTHGPTTSGKESTTVKTVEIDDVL